MTIELPEALQIQSLGDDLRSCIPRMSLREKPEGLLCNFIIPPAWIKDAPPADAPLEQPGNSPLTRNDYLKAKCASFLQFRLEGAIE